jgi:hypothetical protein
MVLQIGLMIASGQFSWSDPRWDSGKFSEAEFLERTNIKAIINAGIRGATAIQGGATARREDEEAERKRIIDNQKSLCQSPLP